MCVAINLADPAIVFFAMCFFLHQNQVTRWLFLLFEKYRFSAHRDHNVHEVDQIDEGTHLVYQVNSLG